MYGMVNQAVKTMFVETVSVEAWNEICSTVGISSNDFNSFEQYDDQLTVDLVVAICQKLEIEAPVLLESFGEYWVVYASKSEYKTILSSFGDNPLDLINSLDALHTRLELTFENLDPPSFHTTIVSDHEVIVHYNSNRDMPLVFFVKGLLQGIFKHFKQECKVEVLEDSEEDKARFRIVY